MSILSKEQERVLIAFLNTENETAYDCETTMNTIHALLNRDLIKRTNYNEIVWFGWEQVSMKFKLTELGQRIAKKLQEGV